jgi:hypothetical protein
MVGVPYTDAEIAKAAEEVKGKTEMEALIAYLQVLGTAKQVKGGRRWTSMTCASPGGQPGAVRGRFLVIARLGRRRRRRL